MPVRLEYFLAAHDASPYYGQRRSMAQVLAGMGGEAFQHEPLPPGWLMRRWGGWEGWTPRDWVPRVQGWKIHVSATPDCAVETLARTTRICLDKQVAFKFLPEPCHLLDTNGKQQDRGASGKFITIYPRDDEQFAELLEELDQALAGQQGPYILSDLRYGDGPIYVRYGGIMQLNFPDQNDHPVMAITSGDEMSVIKDRREPRFVIPDGVELPACLKPWWERSKQSEPSRLRDFKAVSPLHFSNAGGVYKATLPDGTQHVLREARSHTGLDGRGRDAVTRQRDEEKVLRDLIGVTGVQQLLSTFWAWEHRYLELDYVPGRPLSAWMVLNSPFDADPDARAAYAVRAVRIGRQMVEIIERVHAAGWCVGDLHPGNILVSDDDQVTIVDFEDATRVGEPREVGFRVFEYCAPEALDAQQADWYAISRSLMLMFVAEWEIEIIAPDYWRKALEQVGEYFGDEAKTMIEDVVARFPQVPRHVLAPELTVHVHDEPPRADEVIAPLNAGIDWSRQFSDNDSYPGDPTDAEDTSESFTHGRAGVVWARHHLGLPVSDDDLDRLVTACQPPVDDPGLMTGRAGIALVLSDCGRHEAAAAAVRTAMAESAARRRLDLYGGRAGVVLAALEVARAAQDDDLLGEALSANEHLQATVQPTTSAWDDLTHRRGLHFGLTGLALTDLVAHVASGRGDVLERACQRLRADIDACITTDTGELMVRDVDNNRALPYIEWGSAGIWGVTQAAERLTGQVLLSTEEYEGLRRSCTAEVYVYGSLDHGRAGIMAVLASAGLLESVRHQRDSVLAGLLRHDKMVFIVGDGLIRLSSDLATGAAGILVALHCLDGNPFAWMPVACDTSQFFSGLEIPQRPEPVVMDSARHLDPALVVG